MSIGPGQVLSHYRFVEIVAIHAVEEADGIPFFTIELVEGETSKV